MPKSKNSVFSVTKAVKANARTRVGSPPPRRVLPDPRQKAAAAPRHKETLADLLTPKDSRRDTHGSGSTTPNQTAFVKGAR